MTFAGSNRQWHPQIEQLHMGGSNLKRNVTDGYNRTLAVGYTVKRYICCLQGITVKLDESGDLVVARILAGSLIDRQGKTSTYLIY